MNRELRSLFITLAAVAALLFAGSFTACEPRGPQKLQGYIEGEYVYVASPMGGRLTRLSVQRGAQVQAGAPLFALDSVPEQAAVDEAQRRLAQARAALADAQKGMRATELESLQAQLRQAKEALNLAEIDFQRRAQVAQTGAIAQQEIDTARSQRDQAAQRVAQLSAELKTGKLGARSDQIAAAEANAHALEAALSRAQWDLAQKSQPAPQAGLIFDTLYREGEWIAAGKPAVVLLPPANMKLRTFVPEQRIASFHTSDTLRVWLDGQAQPLTARVSFISPEAEYTPPVIYSNESRTKLVYMVEAKFDPAVAVKLHPGQPCDVEQVNP